MAKAEKLYNKSPSIAKDEDGKPGIKRPTEADGVDMGTEGNPLPNSDGKMPIEVHQRMSEMLERHQNELKDMQKRHSKEADKMVPKEDKLAGTPGKEIEGSK